MKCLNLKGEMAKRGITIEELSKELGIHRNSVSNKLNGDSSFTVEEAFKIQDKYFPDLELKYLFKAEPFEKLFQKDKEPAEKEV